MNHIDSSTWLEYFAAGPRAEQVTPAIEDVANVLVPTIVLVEVCRRVMRRRCQDEALQVAA
ncbi:MAG: PIN domain-containing protein [Gemmatimonadaceae bacterium]|nr:PIN domain-containing protein [Gemmatimonadaceae bacterium]